MKVIKLEGSFVSDVYPAELYILSDYNCKVILR